MEAENIITSRQNPLISRIASLSERKYRERERLFRFDGTKLFSEAVFAGVPLRVVLLAEGLNVLHHFEELFLAVNTGLQLINSAAEANLQRIAACAFVPNGGSSKDRDTQQDFAGGNGQPDALCIKPYGQQEAEGNDVDQAVEQRDKMRGFDFAQSLRVVDIEFIKGEEGQADCVTAQHHDCPAEGGGIRRQV